MYKSIVILIIFLLGFYFIMRPNKVEAFTDVIDASGNVTGKKMTDNCPDVLIQKGSDLFLYNSKRGNVPGVNPIRFKNLEEYVEFTDWQRSQGILCPVLFLQHAYNAQGEPVYKARPSPTNLQGGLPDYNVDQNSLPNGIDTQTISNIMNNLNVMPAPSSIPVQGYGSRVTIDNINKASNGGDLDKGDLCLGSTTINATDNYPGFNSPALIKGQYDDIETKLFKGLSPNPMDHNWGGMDFTEKLVQAGYYTDEDEVMNRQITNNKITNNLLHRP
jgi:hypothetical protein